ncbi:MAG TPA: glycosyltransferase family 4 protein [Candidatus Saccharimonadales bacterium]|nr:glycosyltransferase family 4 protein [Candidatus Saccharimonadales bacterium]
MTERPPKLLQVFNRYLEPGGEESAVRQFAQILGPQGNFDECLFDSAEWKGPGAPAKWQQIAWMFYNPKSVAKLRLQQNQDKADAWLVHNVFPVGSPSVYREALRQRIPIIQYIHNFRPFSITGYLNNAESLQPQRWGRAYLRQVKDGAWQGSRLKTLVLGSVLCWMRLRHHYHAVKAWVAISNFMHDQFIAGGVPKEKVFRLYHPRVPVNTEANFPEGDYYLFLGRLIEDKGIKVLLKCWEILGRRLGQNCPRLMVAGDGPLSEWVRAAAAANQRVQYCGYVSGDQKHQLLSQCKAVIQPAIWGEPLSFVIYDAFDYGKPALVARSGGMPELVDETSGLIHQPGNAAELAAQIEEVERRGPDWRRRSGQSGRQWLLANTNVEAWKKQLFEIASYAQRTNSPN